MSEVDFKITDERRITLPIPAAPGQLQEAAKMLDKAGKLGYRLVAASTGQGGHQRDPLTISVTLIARRSS